jgi:fructose/tagatose bisphosphate aldolase
MSFVHFSELTRHAEKHAYAVGYFESWNMGSLLAAADAAEHARSPVVLGFSGIYLPHPDREVSDRLGDYAALAFEVGRRLSVPCCLLFNESADIKWVFEAVDLGFQLVMFTDETLNAADLTATVRSVTERAHAAGLASEGELAPLPGAGGEVVDDTRQRPPKRSVAESVQFAQETGIDAFAVDIGQLHLHGKKLLDLDFERLAVFRRALDIPLVLHGASSVTEGSIRKAIAGGIRKINVGSVLKRVYFETLREACASVNTGYNPYDVVGSLLSTDVEVRARFAMQAKVEELMKLFGSAGMG